MICLILFAFCSVLHTAVNCESLILKVSPETNNFFRTATTSIGSNQNVLRCARKCKNDRDCKGLVFNEIDGQCEVVYDNNSANFSSTLSGTLYEVTNRTEGKACGDWKRMASFNRLGAVTFGSYTILKTALLSGRSLQVLLTETNGDSMSFHINTVFLTETAICAQTETYISYINQTLPNEIAYLICTNGVFQNISRIIGTVNFQTFDLYFPEGSEWFIRETECVQAMYNDDRKSYGVVYNQLKDMQAFIPVVVQTTDNFTKIHYGVQTNIQDSLKRVTITSVGEIVMALNESYVKFPEIPPWITTKYNFTNIIEEEVCLISCETQIKTAHQRTFIDRNWEKVLHHTSTGIVLLGSICTLRKKIMDGKRLLAKFNGKVREPDIVVVDEKDITAFFTSYPIPQDTYDNVVIVWEMLSTSGRYESLGFGNLIGDIRNQTKGSEESIWFVENSEWTRVHGPEYNTTDKLLTAIESGSIIRMKSNCLYANNSATNFTCLFSLEMVQILKGDKTCLGTVRNVPGISTNNSDLHFAKQTKPIWMNFAFSTNDFMTKKIWQHETPYFDSVIDFHSDDINDEWYSN